MDLLMPYLQRLAADGNFSGVILAAEGDRQWLRSYGWADAASGRAMANDTPLRIGSLSKSFTVALVLRLVDDGLLALDQPLQPLLPQFKLPDALTAGHLLRHRSGLGNHTALPDYWPTRMQQYWTPDQCRRLVSRTRARRPRLLPSWRHQRLCFGLAGPASQEPLRDRAQPSGSNRCLGAGGNGLPAP
ncbi:serine hydrolase domain-containing protein [Chromobacterium violaceum]|uniref:serine hydrolase domain-containing protein n=1 Tax=Chromobacterium violaceum TaxID=536 RepID=UPI0009B5B306|nr:serine hydrolase domain-containing protein [Chromobacterium violaceum]